MFDLTALSLVWGFRHKIIETCRAARGTLAFAGLALSDGAAIVMEAGFSVEIFEDTNRDRPVFVDLWYPVRDQTPQSYDYGLGTGSVVESGRIADGKFPLIILSHGAMGAARNYSWIAEALARSGYIVAGVSHYGESYIHGADTVDHAAVLRSWERALDISATISHMEKKSSLSASVDTKQIGFIGHSSGGATGLQLAGVLFDGQKMIDYCNSPSSTGDKGCDYAAGAIVDRDLDLEGEDYRDERIQAFVILDPALGPGFSDFSGVSPVSRILIVGSVENDFLPFRHHAERIAKTLPNASSHWLAKGEGHFIYLNSCDSDLEANGVPLCKDREGVSREETHHNLRALIGDHFNTSFG